MLHLKYLVLILSLSNYLINSYNIQFENELKQKIKLEVECKNQDFLKANYKDIGDPTIGYEHHIVYGDDIYRDTILTLEQANELFEKDFN